MLTTARVPLLGFVAWSGTGKTTLLEQLIPQLKQSGLRVGLIKHGHHDFEIDYPGKDSYRLRQAGASPVMICSNRRRAIITEHAQSKEPRLVDELACLDQRQLDLILVEGFKHERFPKIELHRPKLGTPLLYPIDDMIIALACDEPLLQRPALPLFDLNQPEQITHFVIHTFLSGELACPAH